MDDLAEGLQSEKSLKDYWDVLVRRRWIVISFFTICLTTVMLGTFLMTPVYRATTTIVIEGENQSVLNAEESSATGANYNIFENYLETQMALIKSRSVAGKVAEEFDLKASSRYQEKEGFQKIFQREFVDDIILERVPGTRIISVSVDNPDPPLAANLANRLAETYVEDNLKRRALTFIRNQRMASLNAEFLRLQSKFDSLSTQYGPKHPEMITLKDEIRAMAKRINDERFGNQPNVKQGQVSEDQVLLEDTLLKVQESSVISSSRMNNIMIIDAADIPKEVKSPNKILNILLGFGAGLIGGILLAFLVNYLDDTIRTDAELKRRIGSASYLGSIPLKSNSKKGASIMIERLVESRPFSASAEAYRLIRTGVLWFFKKDSSLKSFAVLSSGSGEGKTTIASNLASALSSVKSPILLVDSDIRLGKLHKVYGVSNDKGLAHYLTEDLSLDEVVQKTEVPNLFLVSCGESVINSSQLLSSPKMEEFIRITKERFEIVVYDTPPVMLISDAAILISQLDAVLLVVRSEVTHLKILQKSLSLIKDSRTPLMGVVLNGISSRDNHQYNKYYQYYQYYQPKSKS